MIICCGEALIDMLPRKSREHGSVLLPVAGGSVFNTAIALGRLGEETRFFSSISTDRFGHLLKDQLTASGVDYTLCHQSERPTTLAFMELKNGQANYNFYDEGTAGQMLGEQDLPVIDRDIDAMVFGGISLISEPCGSAFETLMKRNAAKCVIYLDPNIRPDMIKNSSQHRKRIQRMITLSDIVKVSDEDLQWIEPDLVETDIVGKWLGSGVSLIIITHGGNGSAAFSTTGTIRTGAQPVDIIDTIGAGDSFNAGILSALREAGLLNKSSLAAADIGDIRPALKQATMIASITVSRAGADAPWKSEL